MSIHPTTRLAAIRLRPRVAAALVLTSLVGAIAFGWPLLVRARNGLGHATDAPWLFALLLVLVLAVILAEIADDGMDAKAVALLGVLAALGAALRPLGGSTGGVETVWFLMIPAGRVLGRGFGFVLGALTLFASALVTAGVGPWLPFQMIGAGWVGFFAGCLPRRPRGAVEVAMLCAYGGLAGLAYGLLLDMWFWPFGVGGAGAPAAMTFHPGGAVVDNLGRFVAFHLARAMGIDIPRAVTNITLVALTAPAVLLALRRAARRGAFDAPPEFGPAAPDER